MKGVLLRGVCKVCGKPCPAHRDKCAKHLLTVRHA